MLNYFEIIHCYIPPDSPAYAVYLPHVTLVTAKALRIAQKLGLSDTRQQFIEEASMLHDIGMARVQWGENSTYSTQPYICHAPVGRELLESEGLPQHALVAERHIGLGLSKQEIDAQQLPLPQRDMLPETLEERIITWADLFFSKTPESLWQEKSIDEVQANIQKYGERQTREFHAWLAEFELMS